MKNALILHGTSSNSQGNWFPWLRKALELQDWKVWCPDLPASQKPNIQTYMHYIFGNTEWDFNDQSIIIGHSSGAVAGLGVIQRLQGETKIHKYIGVGAFHTDLGRDDLKDLYLEPLDYELIKRHSQKFVFIHSDTDPHVPIIEPTFLSQMLEGELIIKEGQGHFNLEQSPNFTQFPFLLDVVNLN